LQKRKPGKKGDVDKAAGEWSYIPGGGTSRTSACRDLKQTKKQVSFSFREIKKIYAKSSESRNLFQRRDFRKRQGSDSSKMLSCVSEWGGGDVPLSESR